LVLAGGWDFAIDGQSPTTQHGPWLRLGLAFGRFEAGVLAQTALAAELKDALTEVELKRRAALAYGAFDFVQGESARVAVAVSVGAVSFQRRTKTVAAGLMATEDADKLALGVGAELRAGYTLVAGASAQIELELSACVLGVPAAPVLRYESAGETHPRALWVLEPELRLGPHVRVRL
jgi:hypothetical protein